MKYHAIRTTVDGITFASKKEAARYQELVLLEIAQEVDIMALQPKYTLEVNGTVICKYIGDFLYYDHDKKEVILEDVKGVKTPVYKLKKKLMKAIHGIEIFET